MGDAGPLTPVSEAHNPSTHLAESNVEHTLRHIHVLVTGFGPFKSFTSNPSWLIASALPKVLLPAPTPNSIDPHNHSQTQPQQEAPRTSWFNKTHLAPSSSSTQPTAEADEHQPLRPPKKDPYRIHVHTYPSPIRVAYTPTAVTIPSLLDPATNRSAFPDHEHGISFDYIVHIGLASGRDSYTLETLAHRDGYVIPDNDNSDGILPGTRLWTRLDIPETLHVGWHPQDVLHRWEKGVSEGWEELHEQQIKAQLEELARLTSAEKDRVPASEDAPGLSSSGGEVPSSGVHTWMVKQGMLPHYGDQKSAHLALAGPTPPRAPKKPVVKLSRDAGRFLCEFILMCSLVYRYQEHKKNEIRGKHDPFHPSEPPPVPEHSEKPDEKLGKVAFLHVPNGVEQVDIERGVLVAENAIRALVASWEYGWRNGKVYGKVESSVDQGPRQTVGFETQGTGDR